MPAGFGIGKHNFFRVNPNPKPHLLLARTPPRIVRFGARRSNTDIPKMPIDTMLISKKNIEAHNLIEPLQDAHRLSTSKQVVKKRVDAIDNESTEYMTHTEKRYRYASSLVVFHSHPSHPSGFSEGRFIGLCFNIIRIAFKIARTSSVQHIDADQESNASEHPRDT